MTVELVETYSEKCQNAFSPAQNGKHLSTICNGDSDSDCVAYALNAKHTAVIIVLQYFYSVYLMLQYVARCCCNNIKKDST